MRIKLYIVLFIFLFSTSLIAEGGDPAVPPADENVSPFSELPYYSALDIFQALPEFMPALLATSKKFRDIGTQPLPGAKNCITYNLPEAWRAKINDQVPHIRDLLLRIFATPQNSEMYKKAGYIIKAGEIWKSNGNLSLGCSVVIENEDVRTQLNFLALSGLSKLFKSLNVTTLSDALFRELNWHASVLSNHSLTNYFEDVTDILISSASQIFSGDESDDEKLSLCLTLYKIYCSDFSHGHQFNSSGESTKFFKEVVSKISEKIKQSPQFMDLSLQKKTEIARANFALFQYRQRDLPVLDSEKKTEEVFGACRGIFVRSDVHQQMIDLAFDYLSRPSCIEMGYEHAGKILGALLRTPDSSASEIKRLINHPRSDGVAVNCDDDFDWVMTNLVMSTGTLARVRAMMGICVTSCVDCSMTLSKIVANYDGSVEELRMLADVVEPHLGALLSSGDDGRFPHRAVEFIESLFLNPKFRFKNCDLSYLQDAIGTHVEFFLKCRSLNREADYFFEKFNGKNTDLVDVIKVVLVNWESISSRNDGDDDSSLRARIDSDLSCLFNYVITTGNVRRNAENLVSYLHFVRESGYRFHIVTESPNIITNHNCLNDVHDIAQKTSLISPLPTLRSLGRLVAKVSDLDYEQSCIFRSMLRYWAESGKSPEENLELLEWAVENLIGDAEESRPHKFVLLAYISSVNDDKEAIESFYRLYVSKISFREGLYEGYFDDKSLVDRMMSYPCTDIGELEEIVEFAIQQTRLFPKYYPHKDGYTIGRLRLLLQHTNSREEIEERVLCVKELTKLLMPHVCHGEEQVISMLLSCPLSSEALRAKIAVLLDQLPRLQEITPIPGNEQFCRHRASILKQDLFNMFIKTDIAADEIPEFLNIAIPLFNKFGSVWKFSKNFSFEGKEVKQEISYYMFSYYSGLFNEFGLHKPSKLKLFLDYVSEAEVGMVPVVTFSTGHDCCSCREEKHNS